MRLPGQSLLLLGAWSAAACDGPVHENPDWLRPRPTVYMVPADLTSAVGTTALQVMVDNRGNAVGPALLGEIAMRLRLATWPEDAPISLTTSAHDFEPRRENNQQVYGSAIIRVTPASPLEERWYFLHLDQVPGGVATTSGVQLAKLADGRVGARFAVASEPRMVWLHRCIRDPASMKVAVDFSEPVRIGGDRSVSIESSGACHPSSSVGDGIGTKTLVFWCDHLDPTRPLKVLADATVVGATGRPVRGAGTAIAVPPEAFTHGGDCQVAPLPDPP